MRKTQNEIYFHKLCEAAVNKLQRRLEMAEIYYLTEKTRARFDRNHPVPDIPESLKEKFHKKFEKGLK